MQHCDIPKSSAYETESPGIIRQSTISIFMIRLIARQPRCCPLCMMHQTNAAVRLAKPHCECLGVSSLNKVWRTVNTCLVRMNILNDFYSHSHGNCPASNTEKSSLKGINIPKRRKLQNAVIYSKSAVRLSTKAAILVLGLPLVLVYPSSVMVEPSLTNSPTVLTAGAFYLLSWLSQKMGVSSSTQ